MSYTTHVYDLYCEDRLIGQSKAAGQIADLMGIPIWIVTAYAKDSHWGSNSIRAKWNIGGRKIQDCPEGRASQFPACIRAGRLGQDYRAISACGMGERTWGRSETAWNPCKKEWSGWERMKR